MRYSLFAPVGTLVFIDAIGYLHAAMPPAMEALIGITQQFAGGALAAASRFLGTLGPAIVLPPQIADHAPINYALRLWNAYARE